jgi:hypothetical protein
MKKLYAALPLVLLTASQASATSVAIPEPSMIGLFAGGAVAIVIAYRLRNRK